MAACDVLVNLRYPTMGETSGSVIRALSLGAPARRLGRRLVQRAARRRRPEGSGRRVRGGDPRGGARRWPPIGARRSGASARRYVAARARARPRRRLYVAALETAAGGDAVDDAVLLRIAEAAVQVGIDDAGALARAAVDAGIISREGRARGLPAGLARRRSSSSPSPCGSCSVGAARAMDHGRRADLLGARQVVRRRSAASSFAMSRRAATASSIPILIAPAFRLYASVPSAYAVAKVINACVMSLAAVPTYFLARRLLAPRLVARRRGARGRDPVDALHRHADDGERLLPGLRAGSAAARADARAADGDPAGAAARSLRAGVRHARPGNRTVRRCARRAVRARLDRARRRPRAAPVRDAVRAGRRRRRAGTARDRRPRPLAPFAARCLSRRHRPRLLVRRDRPLPPLARGRARPRRSASSGSRR